MCQSFLKTNRGTTTRSESLFVCFLCFCPCSSQNETQQSNVKVRKIMFYLNVSLLPSFHPSPRLCSKALLEFEEGQGAVVSRKLSRSEVQRFPTKVFDGTTTAGSTQ